MDQTAPARRGTRVGAIWGSAEGAALRRFGCERITPSWDALSSFAHFTRSQGPFLRRRYPATTVIRPRPTPAMAAAFRDVEAATLAVDGSPPITRTTFPTCRAHYPGGPERVRVSIGSPLMQPSPNGMRVGIRIRTFEACSGFTLLRPIGSLSGKAAFVAGLRPNQLPSRAACQLPDQSTIIRVRASLTDSSRLGAHGH